METRIPILIDTKIIKLIGGIWSKKINILCKIFSSFGILRVKQENKISFVKDENKIIMGYLSGSITHNDDFKLIMPSIIKLLKKLVYYLN